MFCGISVSKVCWIPSALSFQGSCSDVSLELVINRLQHWQMEVPVWNCTRGWELPSCQDTSSSKAWEPRESRDNLQTLGQKRCSLHVLLSMCKPERERRDTGMWIGPPHTHIPPSKCSVCCWLLGKYNQSPVQQIHAAAFGSVMLGPPVELPRHIPVALHWVS